MVKKTKVDTNVSEDDNDSVPKQQKRVKLTEEEAKEHRRAAVRKYQRKLRTRQVPKKIFKKYQEKRFANGMKQLNSKEKAEINAQIEREHDEEIEKFKQKHHQPLIDEINKVLQGHELLLNELELAYEDLVKEQAALKVYVDADKSIYEA